MTSTHQVAVIGVAGRFPGACNADQLWLNLQDGVESVTFPDDTELIAAGVPPRMLEDPAYVRAVACAPDVENFDAQFFGYTPRDAENSDPQIRMFLESAHAALENAGYNPYGCPGSVGVYASAGTNRYIDLHLGHAGDGSATGSFALSVLNYSDYLASTVSYKLGLRGPAITLSTACSSSLVAVHLASQALRNGECDVALAGGVEVEMPLRHGYVWDEGGPMSRDGHVRPFDIAASGTLFGTGVGVVVLKRLADALADGDTIHAVIRGSAINNDGSDKAGFSAPSVAGQAIMLTEAMSVAGVSPVDISYIECHATGTPLGDPIEVAALDRAFRALGSGEVRPTSCALTSVKGNIGHLGHAAGAASLIKVVLALRNEHIPGTANLTEPNPKLQLDQTPFYVTGSLSPWGRQPGRPRCAGVSSFGIGGTNAHVVLEEGPAPAPAPGDVRPRVVIWSARTDEAERAYRDKLARHLTWKGEEIFPAAVSTLQEGRRTHQVRRAVVAASARDASAALSAGRGIIEGAAGLHKIAYAFPGQGSQQVAIAAGLYRRDPEFTEALEEVFDLFAFHGTDLHTDWLAESDDQLADTTTAQPLLFGIEYALARMLCAWGIKPDAVLGHSLGELTAAAVAGVFSLPDAAALVHARAQAMRKAPPGGMIAVALPPEQLPGSLPSGLTVAVVNGRQQTVLAGPPPDIDACQRVLAGKQIACTKLKTSGAFHSPLMAAAAAELEEALSGLPCRSPGIPLYSAAAEGRVTDDQAACPAFWAAQVAAPVRFDRALDALLSEPGWRVLEVGPGDALTVIARSHQAVASRSSTFMPVLPRAAGDADADMSQALHVAAQAWSDGHDVVWSAVRGGEAVRRVPLPGYQYQRRRHWVEPRAVSGGRPSDGHALSNGHHHVNGRQAVNGARPTDGGHGVNGGHAKKDARALEGARPDAVPPAQPPDQAQSPASPFSTVRWHEQRRPPCEPWPETDCLLLAPADATACLPVIVALQRAGLRPVMVRPGPDFAQTTAGFTVRPADPADLSRVLATLSGRGIQPRLLVHALSVTPAEPATIAEVDSQLQHSVYSLLALLKAGAQHPVDGHPPAALVITSRSADVTGAEQIDPVKATLHGFARSVIKATPELACRVIDIAEPDTEELAAEVALWPRHEVVALRGLRRWTARNAALHVSQTAADAAGAIRRHGVYLLTGGLGGLGMAVARALAETGLQPRIALLSRRGLPTDAADDRASRLRAQIAEIESLGAWVRVIGCDVTDRRGLRRAFNTVTADFGPVHGVIHLAGVPGGSLVHLRTAQQASKVSADSVREVLAAKVHGTLALDEALSGRPPVDFFACFSSRAATDGLLGSGDYAAANAFQDAYVTVLRRRGIPALSINWPSWAEVGMAAEYGLRTWSAEFGPDNCPMMDEHRIDGEPVMPGAAHIDIMLRGYRAMTGNSDPVRLREIVFHQLMTGQERLYLEVRLHPDGLLETWSRLAADPAARMIRHASARVSHADQRLPQADIAALRSRLPVLRDEDSEPGTYLFRLGPRWDNVGRTWVSPDEDAAELLAELSLPGEFAAETAEYVAYPTLLDSAITAVRRPNDGPHLPFLCDSLELYRDLPAAFLAHVRRSSSGPGIIRADIDMLDPAGAVLARVTGCTLRKIAGQRLLPVGRPDGDSYSAPTVDAGIDPRHGGRLFLTLLRSRHPGQVLVEPDLGESRPGSHAAPPSAPVPPQAGPPRPAPAASDSAQHSGSGPNCSRPDGAASDGAASDGATPDGATPDGRTANGGRAGDGSLEHRVTAIWADAIGDPHIGLDTDFFEIGGNSLTAVALMSHITETFGVELSLAALFDHPTIRGLSQALRMQGAQ